MIFKKTTLLLSALLVALAISGCSKKPRRPNPMDTVTGSGTYTPGDRSGGDLNPLALGDDAGEFGLERSSSDAWIDRARRGEYPTVYFAYDSASITAAERSKLDDAANRLKANPRAKLVLEGHCDWRGTADYNLALGDRRAKAVLTYLTNLGISSARFQTLSMGDLKAPEGASAAQMTQDRRVELLVLE